MAVNVAESYLAPTTNVTETATKSKMPQMSWKVAVIAVNVNLNVWNLDLKVVIIVVCVRVILEIATLAVKWWKFGVIAQLLNYMLNVVNGLQLMMPRNWKWPVVRTSVQKAWLAVIGKISAVDYYFKRLFQFKLPWNIVSRAKAILERLDGIVSKLPPFFIRLYGEWKERGNFDIN